MLHRSRGNSGAPVWIVEYMDYQCPACRQIFYVLEAYLKEYPSQIYLQVRFYPLNNHAHGMRSAIYSECATRQKKFWELYRILFENQNDWADLPDIEEKFHEYSKQAGLSKEALDACVEDPLTSDVVFQEKMAGIKLGVQITPSVFVNGKLVAGTTEIKQALHELFPNMKLTDEQEKGLSH